MKKMGFSLDEMARFSMDEVLDFMEIYGEQYKKEDVEVEREPTQSDIDGFFV